LLRCARNDAHVPLTAPCPRNGNGRIAGGYVFYTDGTHIDRHGFLDPAHNDGEDLIQVGGLVDLLHDVLQCQALRIFLRPVWIWVRAALVPDADDKE